MPFHHATKKIVHQSLTYDDGPGRAELSEGWPVGGETRQRMSAYCVWCCFRTVCQIALCWNSAPPKMIGAVRLWFRMLHASRFRSTVARTACTSELNPGLWGSCEARCQLMPVEHVSAVANHFSSFTTCSRAALVVFEWHHMDGF